MDQADESCGLDDDETRAYVAEIVTQQLNCPDFKLHPDQVCTFLLTTCHRGLAIDGVKWYMLQSTEAWRQTLRTYWMSVFMWLLTVSVWVRRGTLVRAALCSYGCDF
jgi:hypothetical protein